MKKSALKLFAAFFLFQFFLPEIRAQVEWTKYTGNPVIAKGPDVFDINAIGQPTVLLENDTFRMWYAGVGNDWKARICYAYSTDGINWVKHTGAVIDVGGPGEWDRGWLDTPEIVKDNTGYKLYYYGDTLWQPAAINSSMGVAFSSDGINWVKYAGNPVLTKGNYGDWDGTWVESPAVLFDSVSNQYKMWYNGVDTLTWKIQIGLATSGDGINWVKYAGNPVLTTGNWGMYDDIWLGTPAVIKKGNYFEMWYSSACTNSYNPFTQSFDTLGICFAYSTDGIIWVKHSENPLFNTFTVPYDTLVDSGGPWAADVVFVPSQNSYMMWFETISGLSLATATVTSSEIIYYTHLKEVYVYPNPFTDNTYITTAKPLTGACLTVYSSLGKIVFTRHNINGNQIYFNRGSLQPGVYLFVLRESAGCISGRFVVR